MLGVPSVLGDLEVRDGGSVDIFSLDPSDVHDIYLLSHHYPFCQAFI
jgi:hypothetical protein